MSKRAGGSDERPPENRRRGPAKKVTGQWFDDVDMTEDLERPAVRAPVNHPPPPPRPRNIRLPGAQWDTLEYDLSQHERSPAENETMPADVDSNATQLAPDPSPAADAPVEEPVPAPNTDTFDPRESRRERHQGQSQYFSSIEKLVPAIQNAILATFGHPDIGHPCECGASASYRCTECYESPLWCRACAIRAHQHNPFHEIERWDGKMFLRNDLFDSGSPANSIVLSAHRGGTRCPHNQKEPVPIVVVHTNGVHERWFSPCGCPGHGAEDRWQQMLRVKLFPATFSSPQTAFTFRVLDDFHVHSRASKKSAYDYMKALTLMTDSVNPESVPNRYAEFLRSKRLWEFLTLQRRSGQATAHLIDSYLPPNMRRPGSLAIRCPACPEVGFNVPLETIMQASEDQKHVYTLFISCDGNFKLQHKIGKREDREDFSLNDGNAFFVPTEVYAHFLEATEKDPKGHDECGTCNHLKAIRMQTLMRYQNCDISGVVAVQCARHGFYLPQGMVDLTRGEAYRNTDFALYYALSEAQLQRWIFLTYDIWCKFRIKLLQRAEARFPTMSGVAGKMEGGIGKAHNGNHGSDCQDQLNLNFLPNVGTLSGEMIETGWAEHNLTGGSTREMNHGHRRDTIDGTSDYWNFRKLVGLPDRLIDMYRDACALLTYRTTRFSALDEGTKQVMPDEVKKWEAQGFRPRIKDGKPLPVFEATYESGPPTHMAAYQKALAREQAQDDPAKFRFGDVALVELGIAAETERVNITALVASPTTAHHALQAARKRLYDKVEDFHARIAERAPQLSSTIYANPVNFDKPETAIIRVPSSFAASERLDLDIESLGIVEFDLRMAQAYEALDNLKSAIQLRNYNLREKKKSIHGNRAGTRSQVFLRTLSHDVGVHGDTYRRARAALISLGLAKSDPTLQSLTREEQRGKGGTKLKPGDSRKTEPWFWTVQRPPNLTPKEEASWSIEMTRVRWYREHALMLRAREELEILEAEFDRSRVWLTKTAQIWSRIATSPPKPLQENTDNVGWRACAYKQAAMHERLGDKCEENWAKRESLVLEDEEKAEREAAKKAQKCELENELDECHEGLEDLI